MFNLQYYNNGTMSSIKCCHHAEPLNCQCLRIIIYELDKYATDSQQQQQSIDFMCERMENHFCLSCCSSAQDYVIVGEI
jgi:hypothetical protein